MRILAICRLTTTRFMFGCDRQAQQNLFFQQVQHIQLRFRQNAIQLFFRIVQRIQARLISQQQARIKPHRIIQTIQATLASQLASPRHPDIQPWIALFIQTALYRVAQHSLRIFQHIQQARQLGNRHFTADLPAISGKIQAVDERPCIHEARMIYFSPLSVKSH